ncbi:MAG TPA: IS110 family transposase [Pseudolabrys sp.]|nr:IS110 family transposase [Pseudolabrys sp.]
MIFCGGCSAKWPIHIANRCVVELLRATAEHFGAWLGLVPRQISTGDRTLLGRISKQGNQYLRVLFVQAALTRNRTRHGCAVGSVAIEFS